MVCCIRSCTYCFLVHGFELLAVLIVVNTYREMAPVDRGATDAARPRRAEVVRLIYRNQM
jgi:hypothetical protein